MNVVLEVKTAPAHIAPVHATPVIAHGASVANIPAVTNGPVIAAGKNTGVPPNPRPLELLSLQSLTLLTGFMMPRQLLSTLLFIYYGLQRLTDEFLADLPLPTPL